LRQLQSPRIRARNISLLFRAVAATQRRCADLFLIAKALLTTRRKAAMRRYFGDRFNRIAMSRR
jgi:hypothetical protein